MAPSTAHRRVDHESRRVRLLEAADALFGRRGFEGVSAREIALAAGVNKALIFYYFGSMEALFQAVLERYYRAHEQALRQAFEAEGSVAERLHGVIDAYLDFIDRHRGWPRLVQARIAAAGAHSELIARNLAPLYHFTESALAEVADPDGPLAARQFFLTFSGAVTHYFTHAPLLQGVWGGDPLAREAVADRRAHLHWLVDTILEALERAGSRVCAGASGPKAARSS